MLIKDKMAAADNRPSGFDYLRLALALSIVGIHFVGVDYGDAFADEFWHSWRQPITAIVLPMFFSLSGFLVAGSLFRCKTLLSFLGLRVLRIVPALAVEIILSALILGPIFTTLPLSDYFQNKLFYRYFFNIVGHVQFLLPGVFVSNPHPNVVNEQLWTIPWELRCYILIAAMSLIAVVRSRYRLIAFVLLFNAAVIVYSMIKPLQGLFGNIHGIMLVESFLAGIVLFVFRDRLMHSKRLFVPALIATVALLLIRHGDYLVSFPAAYVTVYLGLLNPPRQKIVLSGDYSYGIYLYGFPIQQAIACVNGIHRSWYLDAVYVLPLTLAMAVLSWWLVEKPALALRKYLPHVESVMLRVMNGKMAAQILRRRPGAPDFP